MVKGLHFYRCFLTSGHSKRFSISPNIHPCAHIHTPKAVSALQGDSQFVGVRRLAQGRTDTPLGGAGDRSSKLLVTSQPPLPPEPNAARFTVPTPPLLHDRPCASFLPDTLPQLPVPDQQKEDGPTPPVQPSQSRVPKEAAAHSSTSSSLSNLPDSPRPPRSRGETVFRKTGFASLFTGLRCPSPPLN